MKNSIFSLSIIFLLFIVAVKSQYIYSSINQTDNIVEIKLSQPLFKLNITNLDYLYRDITFNGQSILNSCIFNSENFSYNLTNLKNKSYSFLDNYNNTHLFAICSDLPETCGAGVQSCTRQHKSNHFISNCYLKYEKFDFGEFGYYWDKYELSLHYTDGGYSYFSLYKYYFHCDETQEFSFIPRDLPDIDAWGDSIDIDIKTKYVCPKRVPINYSLIQPNTIRFTLDEHSTNLISFNNEPQGIILPIKPIIYSCKNEGDIITVDGLFLDSTIWSRYTFLFSSSLPTSAIISFNSTTVVLNSTNYIDNSLSISLSGILSDYYSILKPYQQTTITAFYDVPNKMVSIKCTNCIGAVLRGTTYSNIFIGEDMSIKLFSDDSSHLINDGSSDLFNDEYCFLTNGGIYLESPISPFKRSNILELQTNFTNVKISGNYEFPFEGSVVTIEGSFIPKIYNNQPYIIGTLNFLNGTIYNLEYTSNNYDCFSSTGTFKIPFGYGKGTFSIFIIKNGSNPIMVHSNSFSYRPPEPSYWVTSMKQDKDKIELQLSFPHYFFEISSIKYNNENGKELDFKLVEQNTITFTLNSGSSNILSFNNGFHFETISQFSPIVYNYSIVDNTLTMDGLYLSSSMPNYMFSGSYWISDHQVIYFSNSRISLSLYEDFEFLFVYSDLETFIKVPDIEVSKDANDTMFITCSNCFGGYIDGIVQTQNNQDINFSEFGTIVKQFDCNTTKLENVYTFIKGSKKMVLQPPMPTFIGDQSFFKFSTFRNEVISIEGNFLYDKYNGLDYTSFEFYFHNGTRYSFSNIPLSNDSQNYKYQFVTPFAFGNGVLRTVVKLVNGVDMTYMTEFLYPTKPIINSVSNITIGNGLISNLTISGSGFFPNLNVVATFKKISPVGSTQSFYCSNVYIFDTGLTINCSFSTNIDFSIFLTDVPITIQLNTPNYNPQLEPAYIQTYLVGKVNSNNGTTLNSISTKLIITTKLITIIIIILTILIQ